MSTVGFPIVLHMQHIFLLCYTVYAVAVDRVRTTFSAKWCGCLVLWVGSLLPSMPSVLLIGHRIHTMYVWHFGTARLVLSSL
jgi:hypothetical protein